MRAGQGRAGREEGVAYRTEEGGDFEGLPWGIRDAGALRGLKQTRAAWVQEVYSWSVALGYGGAGQRALTR